MAEEIIKDEVVETVTEVIDNIEVAKPVVFKSSTSSKIVLAGVLTTLATAVTVCVVKKIKKKRQETIELEFVDVDEETDELIDEEIESEED